MTPNDKALAVYQPQQVNLAPAVGMALSEAKQLGTILAESGYFGDRLSAAQAVVKIIKGQSLGIDPVSAMQGMEFVQGKLTMGAGLIASLIQRSGRFGYRVRHHDDERCEIEFEDLAYQPPRSLGVSTYSVDDAKKAGLAGRDMWTKYRRNMLFARALTNGARWYCPAVFSGPVYTPDEIRDNPDGDDARTYDAATGERAPTPLRAAPPKPRASGGREQAKRFGDAAGLVQASEAPARPVEPNGVPWVLNLGGAGAEGCQAYSTEHDQYCKRPAAATFQTVHGTGALCATCHERLMKAAGNVTVLPAPVAAPPADDANAIADAEFAELEES